MTNHVTDEVVDYDYDYDAHGRLTDAQVTSGGTDQWTYTYNVNGNRTQSTFNSTTTYAEYKAGNVLCYTAGTNSSTNSCSNRPSTRTDYTYDNNGNLISSDAGHSFTYNTGDIVAAGASAFVYGTAGVVAGAPLALAGLFLMGWGIADAC